MDSNEMISLLSQILDEKIGMVTAYAYAKSKGYSGSADDFANDMANIGVNISAIETAINTFNNETVPNAEAAIAIAGSNHVTAVNTAGQEQLQNVTAEGGRQVGLVAAAGSAQTEAVNNAGTSQIIAVNAAGTTQAENVNTAGSNQVSAVQAKGEEVLESIPSDYTDLSNDVSDLKTDFSDLATINYSDNILPDEWEDGAINNSGQEIDSQTAQRTGFIALESGKSTLFFLRTSADPQYFISIRYYSAASTDNFVSATNVFTTAVTSLKNNVAIPANATYFRLSVSKTRNGNICVSYTDLNEYVPYSETLALNEGIVDENSLDDALKAKINNSLYPFYGKKIAFMGDSIIGNFYDSTGVCAVIAEKTGAEVINCAFGGSRMGYVYSAFGDTTPTATGYIEGATDAQKNQVDQYRYWNALSGAGLSDAIASGVWTLQDNAVANMTGAPAYFAERLATVKAVDWSTVDFVMWEHGTNDFMTRVALEGSDLFAYDVAYRHAIETILTAYPHIRIIPVTPIYRWYQSGGVFTDDSNTHTEADYTGTSHKLTDFVAMAQAVSREYQLPCIDDYYTLGANRFTRLEFFNSTDGTHPNANGRLRIAEHIASQMDSVV